LPARVGDAGLLGFGEAGLGVSSRGALEIWTSKPLVQGAPSSGEGTRMKTPEFPSLETLHSRRRTKSGGLGNAVLRFGQF